MNFINKKLIAKINNLKLVYFIAFMARLLNYLLLSALINLNRQAADGFSYQILIGSFFMAVVMLSPALFSVSSIGGNRINYIGALNKQIRLLTMIFWLIIPCGLIFDLNTGVIFLISYFSLFT